MRKVITPVRYIYIYEDKEILVPYGGEFEQSFSFPFLGFPAQLFSSMILIWVFRAQILDACRMSILIAAPLMMGLLMIVTKQFSDMGGIIHRGWLNNWTTDTAWAERFRSQLERWRRRSHYKRRGGSSIVRASRRGNVGQPQLQNAMRRFLNPRNSNLPNDPFARLNNPLNPFRRLDNSYGMPGIRG